MGLKHSIFLLILLAACDRKPEAGFLRVDAPAGGSFEIYRIANESPLQFISEQAGRFGEELSLTPGSYLVLADCSSEQVIIYPGQHEQLAVHRIEFVPPHAPGAEDSFSIQCSRSDKTRSRQLIEGRYELNMFAGKRDLLVGMVPMHVDLSAFAKAPTEEDTDVVEPIELAKSVKPEIEQEAERRAAQITGSAVFPPQAPLDPIATDGLGDEPKTEPNPLASAQSIDARALVAADVRRANANEATAKHRLSALQVADFEGNKDDVSFFVSPVDELISVTKYQRFGHWEFLLPGHYALEVNGTRMQVDLKEGEERIIKPALLKVSTSSAVDLDTPAKIKGSPWLVEINAGHWLNFNEIYPILPGLAQVGISGSSQTVEINPEEGQTVELSARSITVDLGCATEDLSCKGERDISVSLAGEPYPFVESVSDIPVLFIDEGTPVFVGVGGSRDISYEVPATVHDKTLQVGYAKLVPVPQHRPGQQTDFTRVDATGAPFAGHTLDIILEKPTLMPLIAGAYQLTHYVSGTAPDSGRQSHNFNFRVEPGKTVTLEFPVFLSEKKYAAWKKAHHYKGDPDAKPSNTGLYRRPLPTRLF